MTAKKKILVIDIGGTHVKLLATGRKDPVKIDSGMTMTPRTMVADVKNATKDWSYDVISIGYPGVVVHGRLTGEPHNLAQGWVGFDFAKAFGKPVRIANDAAMQALGSYEGGRMLFLGLGTGLGSALVLDGVLEPMELAHLPYRKDLTYEDYLGVAGLEKHGKKKWREYVFDVVRLFRAALQVDYVVIGGGNAKALTELPPGARRGSNDNAFIGGFRLWDNSRGNRAMGDR